MKNLLNHLQKLNGEDIQVQLQGNINTMIEMQSFNSRYKEKTELDEDGIEIDVPYIIFSDNYNEDICEIWLKCDDISTWGELTCDGECEIEFNNGNVISMVR